MTARAPGHVYLIAGANRAQRVPHPDGSGDTATYGTLVKGDAYLMAGSGPSGQVAIPGPTATTGGSGIAGGGGQPDRPPGAGLRQLGEPADRRAPQQRQRPRPRGSRWWPRRRVRPRAPTTTPPSAPATSTRWPARACGASPAPRHHLQLRGGRLRAFGGRPGQPGGRGQRRGAFRQRADIAGHTLRPLPGRPARHGRGRDRPHRLGHLRRGHGEHAGPRHNKPEPDQPPALRQRQRQRLHERQHRHSRPRLRLGAAGGDGQPGRGGHDGGEHVLAERRGLDNGVHQRRRGQHLRPSPTPRRSSPTRRATWWWPSTAPTRPSG